VVALGDHRDGASERKALAKTRRALAAPVTIATRPRNARRDHVLQIGGLQRVHL
jgi:hypothetical protein